MDNATKEDIEFAFKVANVDWETRELINSLLKLEDCQDLREATTLAEGSLDQLRDLIVARYQKIVTNMEVSATLSTRDERIRAQGGQ